MFVVYSLQILGWNDETHLQVHINLYHPVMSALPVAIKCFIIPMVAEPKSYLAETSLPTRRAAVKGQRITPLRSAASEIWAALTGDRCSAELPPRRNCGARRRSLQTIGEEIVIWSTKIVVQVKPYELCFFRYHQLTHWTHWWLGREKELGFSLANKNCMGV